MSAAPPNAWTVQHVIGLARDTLASLRDDHGQIIEDDDALLAALAGEGVGVETILARIGGAILDRAAMIAAADARIADIRQRRDRYARQYETLRGLLIEAMKAVGLKHFPCAEFSASLRSGVAKLHISEADLPPSMVIARTVTTPDREAIRIALAAGEAVSGATLGNAAPVLTIRSR